MTVTLFYHNVNWYIYVYKVNSTRSLILLNTLELKKQGLEGCKFAVVRPSKTFT